MLIWDFYGISLKFSPGPEALQQFYRKLLLLLLVQAGMEKNSDPIAIGLRIYLGVMQDKFVSHYLTQTYEFT